MVEAFRYNNMADISTKNLAQLPGIDTLRRLCQSLAVLDAIISEDWELRYYSYNRFWSEGRQEEFFQMRDGSGDEFQILFSPAGCVINGLAHESGMSKWIEKEVEAKSLREKLSGIFGGRKKVREQVIWKGVVDSLPAEFHDFIFGEPVKSIGTTFCIWRKTDDAQWNIGNIDFPKDDYGDGSADLLYILDNDPQTYRAWALDYYDETFEDHKLKLESVKHVYDHKPISRKLAQQINPGIEDFEALKKELDEIGYGYTDL
jgi:hypothetical protein